MHFCLTTYILRTLPLFSKINSMPFFSALTCRVALKDLPLLAVIHSTFTALPSTRSLYCASESITPLISLGMFTRSARRAMSSLVCGSMETYAANGSPFLGVISMVLPRLPVAKIYSFSSGENLCPI